MTEAIQTLANGMKGLAGSWASYSTLASLALYVVGYLSLRFHLTALGVGTDLTVLDERYLFTGAKFLVYLCSTVPILVLLGLILALVYAIALYLPYRLVSAGARARISTVLAKIGNWCGAPTKLALTGIVLSVVFIQLVMRWCFAFGNLLLRKSLPSPEWMRQLLLTEDDGVRMLFFCGLVCGVIATGGLFVVARQRAEPGGWSRSLISLLGLLLVIEVLFLPVNYGVLIIDKVLPKVSDLGGVEQLAPSQDAWLVWEGKEAMTYLVCSPEPDGVSKKLITMPLKEIKKTQIVRYDAILRCVFVGKCGE